MKHETALRLNPGDEIILKDTGEVLSFVSYRYHVDGYEDITAKSTDHNYTLYRHRRDFRLPKVDPNAKLRVQYEQDEKVYPRPRELWQFKISENSPEWGSSIPNWVKGFIYRRHPHADHMIQYEKDKQWHPRPWELWELWDSSEFSWNGLSENIIWDDDNSEYRRKPFVVNGIVLKDEPIRIAPENGTLVYVLNVLQTDGVEKLYYHHDGWMNTSRLLKLGLLYLTQEAARAHFEAMVAPGRIPE